MAWWLLHEELNGTMDETYPIKENGMSGISTQKHDKSYYDFDRNKPPVYPADHPSQQFWHEDGFSLTGNPGTASPDTITFSSNGIGAADTLSFSDYDGYGMGQDHISFGDDPYPTLGSSITGSRVQGGMGSDTINIPPYPHAPFKKVPELSINKVGVHKYEEDKGIADLKDYVSSTYSGHYTTKGSNVQTLDLIESVGDAESFCRSNAIKYLSRYDKKGQAKRDILKAMHYCLLLYYFSGNTQNEITTRGYETF
jgi:hypothetical protein